MFKNNNKYLIFVKKLLCAVHIGVAVLGCVVAAIRAININLFIPYVFGAIVLCFLLWVNWNLTCVVLSYFQDIKLIRNKLYDVKEDEVTTMFDEK